MATASIHGTIDTVSMQHLCRAPAVRVKSSKSPTPVLGLELIKEALKSKRLALYLDTQGGLKDEWIKTCGNEMISQLLIAWADLEGITHCQIVGGIKPSSLNQLLKANKFNDAGDKLIVKIGIRAVNFHAAPVFHIATTDSDFWDPSDPSKLGQSTAPDAVALAAHDLESAMLVDFMKMLA